MSQSTDPQPKRVLLTGASGFIASHILDVLLEEGYHVRCTIRSSSKQAFIQHRHSHRGAQLEFAIVPDMAAPGAFDTAVVGMDYVVHTAAPVTYNVADVERDMINPAIDGTRGLLRSVQLFAPTVKRVVYTSTFAAILDFSKLAWPGRTFSEDDWNPLPWERRTAPGAAYLAAKKFSEKAAWDFVNDETDKPHFDLAVICPPHVWGPINNDQSISSLNVSTLKISNLILGKTTELTPGIGPWCDVRDVAVAHVRAMTIPTAGGQRFAPSAGEFHEKELVDIMRKHWPESIKVEDRDVDEKGGMWARADGRKCREVLGLTFRSLEECIVDTCKSIIALEQTGEQKKEPPMYCVRI